jgi:hypothetical protein
MKCGVQADLIKVLANRLKVFLPHIISPEQSAFIPGQLITNNILVAFETLHTMETQLKGREGYIALKLDMSKAYDQLEWEFLEAMMWKLMSSVRSVAFSILMNGQPHGHIVPTRGIRQGDPLSPNFFIICVDALSTMLNHSARMGKIFGVLIFRGGTKINHLLFASDSLLFGCANLQEWRQIKDILDIYERASRQKVNLEKTSLFFSRNTREDDWVSILQGTRLNSTQYETYLGLPALVG